jgi:transcriptional regulator with XRE-family HTH domain
LRQNVTRAIPFLRQRAGLRQDDLAARVGVSREMVSRLERGALGGMTLASVERIAAGLGATLHLELRWRGEQLDRLMDAAHAVLEQTLVRDLRAAGCTVEVEVSFSVYGDRGRCDAVAYHADTGTLLIVEAKTRLGDVQELLGRLDVKARLGPQIARRLGWPAPRRVVPCLVVAEGRTARRVIASHPDLFARFELRGASARRWLANPTREAVSGILLFESVPYSHLPTTRRRVRRRLVPDSRQA